MTDAAVLEGRELTKRFGGVTALDQVDFRIAPGRITALLGENGAGKSTLVACLSGAQRPDEGEIVLGGAATRFRSPHDARRAGIAVIHQEPQMLEEQTVAANIYLTRLAPGPAASASTRSLTERAEAHLHALQIRDLDPTRPMRSVTGAQRQLIEIARALVGEPRVLFLDEPNASLGEAESERLFDVVRQLRGNGVAVVLVSHRLREVYSIADHVVVMRDGVKVADDDIAALPVERAIHFITGEGKSARTPTIATPIAKKSDKSAVIEVQNLTGPGFRDVSFAVSPGEILGMSGLVGSGRTEIAHVVIGATPPGGGSIRFQDAPARFSDPSAALRAGIAFVPEGRRDAVFYGQSVDFNIRSGLWGRLGTGKKRASHREAGDTVRRLMRTLAVKASGPDAHASTLSGGNQQKLLLARALSANPALLILDEPTHGVDVGTKREIHGICRALAAEGMAIWFISSEVEEIVELATRIIVVHQGRIAGELPGGAAMEDVLARNFGETRVLDG